MPNPYQYSHVKNFDQDIDLFQKQLPRGLKALLIFDIGIMLLEIIINLAFPLEIILAWYGGNPSEGFAFLKRAHPIWRW